MPFIEDEFEFKIRNGGGRLVCIGGSYYSLANGAVIYRDGHGGGDRRDPPKNPHERQRAVRRYWEVVLNEAEGHFYTLRAALSNQARGIFGTTTFTWDKNIAAIYGPSTEDGEQDLLRIKAAVEAARAKIEEIDQSFDESPQVRARKEHEEFMQQVRRQQADEARALQGRVERITI